MKIFNRTIAVIWVVFGIVELPQMVELLTQDGLSNAPLVWAALNGFGFIAWTYWSKPGKST